MQKIIAITLWLVISGGAQADVWSWLDVHGDIHFVDSKTAIFTWVDELGKVHYSDKPGHEDAVGVQLVWHSTGQLADVEGSDSESARRDGGHPDETPADRHEREMAEAYYCKRATEIYDSYANSPRLYKTNSDGDRAYLSDEEAAQTTAETKTKMTELCR
jgi:hypothetical protein